MKAAGEIAGAQAGNTEGISDGIAIDRRDDLR
jgi:hypothetical protein